MAYLDETGLAHLWGKISGLSGGNSGKLLYNNTVGYGLGTSSSNNSATITLSSDSSSYLFWIIDIQGIVTNCNGCPILSINSGRVVLYTMHDGSRDVMLTRNGQTLVVSNGTNSYIYVKSVYGIL